MHEIKQLYLELLLSAIKEKHFFRRQIPNKVFDYYLELTVCKEKVSEDIKDKYRNITKSQFKDSENLDAFKSQLDEKIDAFEESLSNIDIIKRELIELTNREKEEVSPAYELFCNYTGQKREMPLELYKLNNVSLQKIADMVEQIGCDLIKLEMLQEIDNQLKFSDKYIPLDEEIKLVVDKAADACREIYMANTNISREDLINKVLSEYRLKIYDDKSPKERKRLTIKAVKQWVRHHKNYGISN